MECKLKIVCAVGQQAKCFELSKETTYIVFELEITRFDCTVHCIWVRDN